MSAGTKTMAASVTHFEIYAEDLPKLAGFYQELFGWQIDKAPGIDYLQIQTGTVESAGIGVGCCTARFPDREAGCTTSRSNRSTGP